MSQLSPTATQSPPSRTPRAGRQKKLNNGGDGEFAFETTRISHRQSALLNRRQSIKLDEGSFAAETYLPEHYLRSTIDADTEDAIQSALRSLGAARDKSVHGLKKAIYKNHGEFLVVAEQLMDFERTLEELHTIQAQIKSTATTLINAAELSSLIKFDEKTGSIQVQGAEEIPQKAANVSTPTIVEPARGINWEERAKKMAALVETLSDFERYVTPERYLVFEGGGITEQVGTSSPKPITLFLFNDAIAMASAKRSRLAIGTSSKRLALERFWLLQELALSNVPDSKNIQNAIKLTKGGEYVLLHTETASSKRLWMQQIAKTQNALENLGRSSPIKGTVTSPLSPFGSHRESPVPGPTIPDKQQQQRHRRMASGASSRKEKIIGEVDAEKIKELSGDLDQLYSEIDRGNYEKAVEVIDRVNFELGQLDGQIPIVHQISKKLQRLILKTADYLYHEITDLIISRENMARFIQLLVVLGFADEARDKFLAARSETIKDRIKHLRITGDVAKTVNDIGFVTFNSIANTADWYISSFKDHPMTAGFVFWTKLEINNYVNIIARQVFAQDTNHHLIAECISIARKQCASLGKIGLDLVFYLDDQLMPYIDKTIKQRQEITEKELAADLKQDDFLEDKLEAAKLEFDVRRVTISVCLLKNRLVNFLNDLEPLLQGDVCELMVMRLASIVENFVMGLTQASYHPSNPAIVTLNILANLDFLTNHMIPAFEQQLEELYFRKFGDLKKLKARISATIASLINIFSENQAKNILPADTACYRVEGMFDGSTLSNWLVTMLPLYAKISRDSAPPLRISIMQELLGSIISTMQRHVSKTQEVTRFGVSQAIFDIHYLLSASNRFLNDDLASKAAATCATILEKFKESGSPPLSTMPLEIPTEEWYHQKVQEISPKFNLDFGF